MLPDYKNTYNARQWIYVAASKQKSENNTTHLYGHGNHYGERSALMIYDKRKEPGNRYSGKFNTKGVRDLLNFENINTNFIDKKGGILFFMVVMQEQEMVLSHTLCQSKCLTN